MKKVVVLTGAGISAESGLKTFRDSDGLWEGHDVMEVATPQAWNRDRALVLEFYNQRRKQALSVNPNAGHNFDQMGSMICNGGVSSFAVSKGYTITFWNPYTKKPIKKFRCY